jgi:hypothetical protein
LLICKINIKIEIPQISLLFPSIPASKDISVNNIVPRYAALFSIFSASVVSTFKNLFVKLKNPIVTNRFITE